MNFYEPGDHFVRIKAEVRNYLTGGYPGFVFEPFPEASPSRVPVFSFHDVSTYKFEAQLLYLQKNGYETLTADEYYESHNREKNGRKVLLTFDDGRISLYNVAYPLLKKYGMKGVAFVMPGEAPESDGGELCSWLQLMAMKDVIDIESHSRTHFIMFTSSKPETFFTPAIRDNWASIDWPTLNEKETSPVSRRHRLGTPIYDMDSRLSDTRRVLEPVKIREACVDFVGKNGGSRFFETADWRHRLGKIHESITAGFTTETEEERIENVGREIAESKKLLESRLGGEVSHLCPPFGICGETALKLAEKIGYKAVYWGVNAGEGIAKFRKLAHVTRIKDDYIFRLPGEGREFLAKSLFDKAVRRFTGR